MQIRRIQGSAISRWYRGVWDPLRNISLLFPVSHRGVHGQITVMRKHTPTQLDAGRRDRFDFLALAATDLK